MCTLAYHFQPVSALANSVLLLLYIKLIARLWKLVSTPRFIDQ
ncbi:hypothetical protein [Streptomyces sp. NPDC017991]